MTPAESLDDLLAHAAPILSHRSATIEGGDPVLPTPYRVATSGSAAIAAVGCAAAELWVRRGGIPQRIYVDARRAAAAMRSASYLRINGERPPPLWDRLSGFYPVKDGRFVSIHCNFPIHGEVAARVLGTPADRAAMEAAARTWEGIALEDAIHAGGGCAGLVRTEDEWRHHPQYGAVANQPLIEIERIGDGPPRPFLPGDQPLSSIRVLDLTRVLAGPTCARALAEHGADVLKINAPHLPHSGAVELDTGMGKRAAFIDLRVEEGRALLGRLATQADVFSQSYRPGTLDARGFSPDELAARRPGIVCATLSAWGRTGPWANRRGFDSIVQCVSGIAHVSGDGTTPKLLPVSAIDYVSGYLLAYGAMVALARRATEGGSWHVRVGLARVGKWIVERGLVPRDVWDGLPAELPHNELDRSCMEIDSPAGRLRVLAPIAEMSETPPRFARPGVMPGAHPPEWRSAD